jgi:tRNA/tmRNA/rRNA uracil-C5-methylase (TrmA/RlmC/RlmD family)
VVAVEANTQAGHDCRANCAGQPGVKVVSRPVSEALKTLLLASANGNRPAVVVLDPPRAGAGPEVVAGLITAGPERVVYVSCEPSTLARDAAQLEAGGYRMAAVQAFDLFPGTAHVEVVAAFTAG